jgi:hypothetical protein
MIQWGPASSPNIIPASDCGRLVVKLTSRPLEATMLPPFRSGGRSTELNGFRHQPGEQRADRAASTRPAGLTQAYDAATTGLHHPRAITNPARPYSDDLLAASALPPPLAVRCREGVEGPRQPGLTQRSGPMARPLSACTRRAAGPTPTHCVDPSRGVLEGANHLRWEPHAIAGVESPLATEELRNAKIRTSRRPSGCVRHPSGRG